MRNVLHVGCGPLPTRLHPLFTPDTWHEVRLDIDPGARPDIVASMTDMTGVPDGAMDALYSSHNIEHLYPHEVPVALKEFARVLKPEGFALVTCPDLQSVAELVAAGNLEDPAYMSNAGPITPLDILYGFRTAMKAGNLFMAHRTGFIGTTLGRHLMEAGFKHILLQRDRPRFALWALAFREAPTQERVAELAPRALPFPVTPAPSAPGRPSAQAD